MPASTPVELLPLVSHPELSAVGKTPILFFSSVKSEERYFDFFTSNIRNRNTRVAYFHATSRFSEWCEGRGIMDLKNVRPVHISAYVEHVMQQFSKPTAKQHLAALRMLFDWMVVGQVIEQNPAHAVRCPKYVMKKGKTPVLTGEEARALIDSIDTGSLIGKRDRALIALMTYAFARVGAALNMKVEDYFVIGRRGRIRLHEKGGKEHEVPCHHNLDIYLEEYIKAAGINSQPKSPLFRSAKAGGRLTLIPLRQTNAYRMIQRRAKAAGIFAHRQPHIPRDWHHGLPEEWRQIGNRPTDRRP
jgi:integrase/recombinase XerD